jgi:hypothetical protein
MKLLLLVTSILTMICISCSRAPYTNEIEITLDKESAIQINDHLDGINSFDGPDQIRVYLMRIDDTIAYQINDRKMDKAKYEAAINRLADIDHRQTIVIEFGDGTSEADLDETPAIKKFVLIGRTGSDRDSLRFIK